MLLKKTDCVEAVTLAATAYEVGSRIVDDNLVSMWDMKVYKLDHNKDFEAPLPSGDMYSAFFLAAYQKFGSELQAKWLQDGFVLDLVDANKSPFDLDNICIREVAPAKVETKITDSLRDRDADIVRLHDLGYRVTTNGCAISPDMTLSPPAQYLNVVLDGREVAVKRKRLAAYHFYGIEAISGSNTVGLKNKLPLDLRKENIVIGSAASFIPKKNDTKKAWARKKNTKLDVSARQRLRDYASRYPHKTQGELATKFGVSKGTVTNILQGR